MPANGKLSKNIYKENRMTQEKIEKMIAHFNTKPADNLNAMKKHMGEPYFSIAALTDESITQLSKALNDLFTSELNRKIEEVKVDENTSDGYHTFKELYEFRNLYNAAWFNDLAYENRFDVHKSKKHHEGDYCFGGGWFIVMAELPTGQISNHYPLEDWDLYQVPEKEKANKWDGHTSQDVAKRIKAYLKSLLNDAKESK